MASRLFVAASSHRFGDATGVSFDTSICQAALVTVASIPGAGVYQSMIALSSGTAARRVCLHWNGDQNGTLAFLVGTNRINPSSDMVPTADGRWYAVCANKTAGTTVVNFMMYDFLTGTLTMRDSSSTFAVGTSANVTIDIGSNGAADFYDGRIGVACHRTAFANTNRLQMFAQNAAMWHHLMFRMQGNNTYSQNSVFVNFATYAGFLDWSNKTRAYATGSHPNADALSTPPGW